MATGVERKKRRERVLFDLAQRCIDVWVAGEVDDTGEQPDIVVATPSHRYGVEVTQKIEGRERADLEAKRIACGRAQKQYEAETGIVGLHAGVVFSPGVRLPKSRQDDVAGEILRIALEAFSTPRPESWRTQRSVAEHFRSEFVSKVWLHFHPAIDRSIWQTVAAHRVPRVSAADIAAEITRKESKLSRYRSRADRVWLLIATDGFDAASAAALTDDVFEHEYVTAFDGVVLLEEVLARATTLRVAQSPVDG
jgi:hypothetical protein